jgi:hypothetical protein
VNDDEQDVAEAFDEDKTDDGADFRGDAFGDDLPDYPPDRPLGVNTVGVTPIEEDAGESFAERTLRELADELEERWEVGQLVEPDASTLDTGAADRRDGVGYGAHGRGGRHAHRGTADRRLVAPTSGTPSDVADRRVCVLAVEGSQRR